jgi:hypothetical protein
MVLVALARSVLQLPPIHISRYYSDCFKRSPMQFQLRQKRTNATSVLRCHFHCFGNVLGRDSVTFLGAIHQCLRIILNLDS